MKNDIIITKLKISEGITAEDPKVVLDTMKNFYNQLYSSQNQPSTTCSSTFFEHESLRAKLDNEKQSLCEGPITAEECLAALKTFQHKKLRAPMASPPSFIFAFGTIFLALWSTASITVPLSVNFPSLRGRESSP